ncbi:IS30 family transposase [Saccharopolyspora erythraea NRRL 2338]|nr:IS30 family transposase [Saccharopolyspora erythraea NRRL 2338]QRK88008.1 IS30 family transposase [Saccharopolyspora erythraea]
MARLGRPGMSDEMKEDLWRRWRAGESISVISREIGKPPGSVFTVLKHHGGIAPQSRRQRAGSLTLPEREEISRGLSAGYSFQAIAAFLQRAVSTISREVTKNGGRHAYRATAAQERAREQARRPKPCLLARQPALRDEIVALLGEEWSPEQIVGHLRRHGGDAAERTISHETIYRSIYTTRWKVIPRELCKRLRTGRPIRKNKRNTVKGQWRSQIIDARPIEQRPDTAQDRSTLGHFEGDLVIGANHSQVATLVDRKTRYLVSVKLPSRHSTVVVPELIKTYAGLDPRLRDTLTWDRGMELAEHKRFTAATGVDVFFAAPRSPWQRGTNENTNKLVRQYLPKGTNLATFTQAELDAIATKLNTRPRKCLGFRTPAEAVALTG